MEQQLLTLIKDKLDFESSTPLYVQLQKTIELAISKKMLVHGSILPSERKLSLALGVSRVTVVKALSELLALGLVRKKHGKGTVVNQPVHYDLAGGGFSSQLQYKGAVSNRWLIRDLVPCCEGDAQALEIAQGETMAKIKRVRLVDGVPVSIESMVIPETWLPRPDLLDGSLYAYWHEHGIEPHIQEYSMSIYTPTVEEACILELSAVLPLMKIVLRSRDVEGNVLEYGTVICRSDYYNFEFKVKVGGQR
ncbi:GntR family transcriptional regulator [Photobacterium nomapromontoriensis]|uniref:GntR family transcriptional regulator n=1 Tax=Photobacterium nomapromontoriensis TaxID=2910237 RepID=UPI003D0FAE37